MSIVAETFAFVIGVDTHAKHHAYAIIAAATGKLVDQGVFPTSPAGRQRALSWIRRRTSHHADVLVAIEGAGSYGKTLTTDLLAAGLVVCDVRPPARGSRARHGKTDAFDALAAARSVLPVNADQLVTPRHGELRDALHVLRTARTQLRTAHSQTRNQLTALLRQFDLGIDARTAPTLTLLRQIAAWRARPTDTIAHRIARTEATRLARTALEHHAALDTNERALRELVTHIAPTLLEMPGIGPVSAAIILDAWSHPGRVRNADAFAALAGAAPKPAQSGNTHYWRLNRSGDRQLNAALHTIARSRARYHQDTITYIHKRTLEGLGHKAILRCLKRFIARGLYRHLQHTLTTQTT